MVYAFNVLPSLMHLWGSSTVHLGGCKSFSTKGKAFKLIQDKDTPFGYDGTKFQTSTLKHWKVMRSEGHPGNGHISNNFMNAQNSSQHGLFTNFNPALIRIQWKFKWNSKFKKQRLLGGVKDVSFRGCFNTLAIVGKIKFLYQRTAKEILGRHSQNERFSSPRARASNVWKKDRCLTPL